MRALQLSHVARGSLGVCCLLLASTLLAGCGGTASSQTAQAAATTQSSSVPVPSSSGTTSTSSGATTPANKTADVSWTAPTTNTNGSALTDLAGYRIFYGTSRGTLHLSVDVPSSGATSYVVQGLSTGTWYFAVAAYTNTGLESSLSAVASKTIT